MRLSLWPWGPVSGMWLFHSSRLSCLKYRWLTFATSAVVRLFVTPKQTKPAFLMPPLRKSTLNGWNTSCYSVTFRPFFHVCRAISIFRTLLASCELTSLNGFIFCCFKFMSDKFLLFRSACVHVHQSNSCKRLWFNCFLNHRPKVWKQIITFYCTSKCQSFGMLQSLWQRS